jgi:hypothetical protein
MRRVLKRDGRVAILVNQALQNNPVYEALYSAIAGRLETTAAAIASPFALGDADELHGLIEGAGFRHVKVEPVTLTVHFPEPSRWVQLAVLSSAAVLPVFGQMEPAERKELVGAVARELGPVLRPHIEGDTIAFPVAVNIGVAHG